jgi:hypothetical protein
VAELLTTDARVVMANLPHALYLGKSLVALAGARERLGFGSVLGEGGGRPDSVKSGGSPVHAYPRPHYEALGSLDSSSLRSVEAEATRGGE